MILAVLPPEGYAVIGAVMFATAAVLVPSDPAEAWNNLFGIACIGAGVALIGVGIALIGVGAAVRTKGARLLGIAFIAAGVAFTGVGVGILRESTLMSRIRALTRGSKAEDYEC